MNITVSEYITRLFHFYVSCYCMCKFCEIPQNKQNYRTIFETKFLLKLVIVGYNLYSNILLQKNIFLFFHFNNNLKVDDENVFLISKIN